MSDKINFYKDKIVLNFLAKDIDNAKECLEACDGYGLVGILSADYETIDEAKIEMKKYKDELSNKISIGLGGGNPLMTYKVAKLTSQLKPQHANQVFTGVGITRGVSNENTFINALVSPTGKVGYVNISTGPLSKELDKAIVPIDTAIAMIKDMGGDSIKYFPMNGLESKEEYVAVCMACAKAEFAIEPSGGLDLNNYKELLEIALNAGVKRIIPHLYSSIIDSKSGLTRVEDVKKLFEITKDCIDSI